MAEIVTLSIKEFRAIKEANIKLNGITVVSGVNGCGKSTLSKFLYYTFKIANNYDKYVLNIRSQHLSEFIRYINILINDLYQIGESSEKNRINTQRLGALMPKGSRYISENKEVLHLTLNVLKEIYINCEIEDKKENKFKEILKDILHIPNDNSSFSELIDKLILSIDKVFEITENYSINRPASILKRELSSVFSDSSLPIEYEISEYGDTIIGNESKSISIVHTVQKVAYIDTPMALWTTTFNQPLWDDLNNILIDDPKGDYDSSIDHIISSEILKGESKQVESNFRKTEFKFIRENGAVYDLFECATGVKSFSILQTMLRNGFLTSKTLLIIDEPEAHLHPQWIVEYARLIVLLNKNIGVKFFIASHNPDMISAIKYISEKEKVDANLHFYLAEQVDSTNDLYTYKDLGTDIDPIFHSFNIALDRINLYGESDD